jgi:hypothetical protein
MSSKKSYAPPPPDYSGIIAAQTQAANSSLELQREQMAWARQQYAKTEETSDKIIESALARQNVLDEQAAEDRARYKETFQPLEDQLVAEAQDYATPARIQQRSGAAMAEVSNQYKVARAAAQDRLESFGIDPSQTRAGALDLGTRISEAAARAGAGNMSREQTEATARALRSEALAVGRGYPGMSAQGYQLAGGQGALAGGTQTAGVASGSSSMGTPQQWGALGTSGLGAAADTMKTGYNQLLDQYKYNQAERSQGSGWGSALGLIGGLGLSMATAPASSALGGLINPLFRKSYAEGGMIDEELSPSGDRITDDIPAQGPTGAIQLDGGEFVVPEDVVKWKGEEFFQRTIESSRKKRAEAPAKPEVRRTQAIALDPGVQAAMGVSAPPDMSLADQHRKMMLDKGLRRGVYEMPIGGGPQPDTPLANDHLDPYRYRQALPLR